MAEGREQRAWLAEYFSGDQRPHAQHLIAVIGVRDDVAILAEDVENREGIGSETADAARLFMVVEVRFADEPLVTEGEGRAPHIGKGCGGDELVALRPVRIDGDVG